MKIVTKMIIVPELLFKGYNDATVVDMLVVGERDQCRCTRPIYAFKYDYTHKEGRWHCTIILYKLICALYHPFV